MALPDVIHSNHVARRLTAPRERWGWEFDEPAAVQPYPHPQPQWREPYAAELSTQSASYQHARAKAPKRAVIAGAILLLGLCAGKYGIVLDLVAIGLACLWFLPLINGQQAAGRQRAEHEQRRQQAWDAHNVELDQWRAAESQWRAREQQRVAAANKWFPVEPQAGPSRLDVFGGVPEGWSDFLVTFGSGLLAAGSRLTVVDLSEAGVADRLATLAGRAGIATARVSLPAGLHQAGLLDGLSAEDAAEVIAEALHARRGSADAALRDVDADILGKVAGRLDGSITFERLVAALRIVQRTDDPAERDPVLKAVERQRLAEYADVLGAADRMQAQVQELRSTLESLTAARRPDAGADAGPDAAPAPALTVFVSEDANTRRRDLLDRLVVRTLIHRLRHTRDSGDVIAVAGADHLGTATVEELARSARRAGVRLVLLIEHLREEFEPYLGGSDSVSVFMRMGNAKEAARAAEHIGRGHTFQLTQLSRTEGRSTSRGTTTSHGENHGTSHTTGRSGGGGSSGWNESTTTSHGVSAQQSTSNTTTDNESDGVTQSRVYEFTVEPTRFQDLDAAGFILVEPLPGGGRRVVAGTCDPAVLTLRQVADTPLPADRRAARVPAQPQADTPRPPDQVNIVDPTGELRWFADRLSGAGYLVQYRNDADHPVLNGWLITGHRDGRQLNEQEIMSYR